VCPTLAPRRAWRLLGKWLRSHVGRAILSSYLPNPRLSGSSISLCGAVAYSYKTRVNTPHKTRHATTKTSRIPQIMSCKLSPETEFPLNGGGCFTTVQRKLCGRI